MDDLHPNVQGDGIAECSADARRLNRPAVVNHLARATLFGLLGWACIAFIVSGPPDQSDAFRHGCFAAA